MIYYCYRQTENWKEKKISNFWFVKETKSYNRLLKYIENWNNTQKISYFDFRDYLKNISQQTFKDSNIDEIKLENLLELNDDDWVIPFDDDDWFCKDFKRHIENENKPFIYGNVITYNIHEANFQKVHQNSFLLSNQYAIKIKALKNISVESCDNIIQKHRRTKKEIAKNKIAYKYVNETISTRIISYASTELIVRTNFKKNDFKLEFGKTPNYADWCEPYLEKLKLINTPI